MSTEQAKFLEGSLFRHITTMSLTASVGLMAVFIVDFVDMIFISMLGKEELAAAVGYAGAILFFTTSFGIGMSIAAGALTARAIGSGDAAEGERRTATSLFFGVVFGSVFAAIVWFNLPYLSALMGACGATLDLSVEYLRIIVPSLPFLLAGMVGSAVLRAHGDARRAMMATIWGGVANAVLDPILIFGLGLELKGAAIASVAARMTIAGVALYPLIRTHGGVRLPTVPELKLDLSPIMAIAFPAILTQLATPIGQAYVTRSMAPFGEEAVAGMAIVGRIVPIAFAVIFALSGALGPIIGQNFGTGKYDRVRGAVNEGILFIAIYTIGVSAILFLLRQPITILFQAEGISRDLIYLFCGPLALAWFANGVIFASNAAFNNLGHPYYSTWINWGRHTLGTIPFVIGGAYLFGAEGVLIGQAAGGVIFALAAWVMVRRVTAIQDQITHSAQPFQRQARQITLFHNRR